MEINDVKKLIQLREFARQFHVDLDYRGNPIKVTMTKEVVEFTSSLIKSRNSWGAKTTRCTTRHKPTKATIHHSVTPNNDSLSFQARLRQIQNFHQSVRGWCDIGYHYLISKDGSVWQGRNADLQGAHVGGNNHGNLGISFLGTFSNVKPSGAQLNSAAKLLRNIKSAYAIKINSSTIKGHRDYGGTACPGSSLYGKIAALIYSANQNSSVNSPSPNNPQIKVSVNLLSPSNNASVDNPVTFKFKFKNVDQLYVKANGWNFHSKKNPGENYSFTYKFHSTGLRDLVIEASNSKTGKVEKISRKINVRSSQNFINPSLKLLSPSDGVSLKNPVTFKFETKDIDNLTLKADGYLFHSKTTLLLIISTL